MKNNKPHIVSRLIALVLLIAVVLPTTVKLEHAFENHKHEVCDNHATSHFHENVSECELYKFKLNNNYTFSIETLTLFSSEIPSEDIITAHYFVNRSNCLQQSLRGPPQLV